MEELYTIVPKEEVTKRKPFGLKLPKLTSAEFLGEYPRRKRSPNKILHRIESSSRKVLDRLYLSSSKSMLELLEETSLDGFKVIKKGDSVNTPLGKATIKKIERNKVTKKVMYGVTLEDKLQRIYKSNSVVYFEGSKLSL